jgi:hypothetical protein
VLRYGVRSKTRSKTDAENLSRFVTFSGTISRGDLVVPIRFRVRFGVDGELRFRVYPLRMTREAVSLRSDPADRKSTKLATYSISAASAGGTRFESDGIVLRGSGTRSTQTTAHVTLNLGYTKATFTRDQDNGDTPPTIQWTLRGFECFPAVQGMCDLGKVGMQGNYPDKGADRVSGVATIRAEGPVADVTEWMTASERLFLHLRDVMSFAMSRQVGYPIRDTWIDGRWERVAYSQTKSRRSHQHVHHPMMMQAVFDAALSSHFRPPITAKNLGYAIEWLTMQATYTEMRLTNVITALENLANSNLPESDQQFLSKKTFAAFAKRMRDFAGADLATLVEGVGESQVAAAQAMRDAMPGKLQDLNRRPLFDRIMVLADRWRVPTGGLDDGEIRAAIVARNNIVHRGYYYEPDRGTREQADLWDHVLTVRELAIRFVLTIIGFRGSYLSFRGGQYDVSFPPAE